MTSKPALTRLAAIGPPMMPRPMKPRVVMRFLLIGASWYRSGVVVLGQVRRRRGAREGTRRSCRRWCGLGRTPTRPSLCSRRRGARRGSGRGQGCRVPGPGARGERGRAEVRVEIERAGSGLWAPGSVGDLHVGDPVAVGGDHPVKVVAVDGEMVEIAEETEVAHARLAGHAGVHPH